MLNPSLPPPLQVQMSRAVAREQHRRLNKSAKTAILAAAAAAAAAAGNGSLGSGEVQELMRQASRASVSFMPVRGVGREEFHPTMREGP